MTRPEFMANPRALSAESVQLVLGLVNVQVPLRHIHQWCWTERLVAVDYAVRVHLRASDNPVKLRPLPSFVANVARMGPRE